MTAPALVRAPERRLLSREEAADYLGIGTSLFDDLVDDQRLPKPMPKAFTSRRVLWDRWAIDQRITDLQLSEAADEDDWTRAA